MLKIKVLVFALFTFIVGTLAMGTGRSHQGGDFGGQHQGRGFQGQNYGADRQQQQLGRQYGGQNSKNYRSNLYNDDDVYGYDALYPGGEAAYVNFKSKDARSRRGPEFAKVSRAYSGRQEGGGDSRGYGFGQMSQGGHGGKKW